MKKSKGFTKGFVVGDKVLITSNINRPTEMPEDTVVEIVQIKVGAVTANAEIIVCLGKQWGWSPAPSQEKKLDPEFRYWHVKPQHIKLENLDLVDQLMLKMGYEL